LRLEYFWPCVAVIFNQTELDAGLVVLRGHLERNLPRTLRITLIAPQSEEDDAFNIARHACLDSKPEDQAVRLIDPQSQTELLRFRFLAPKRPDSRFFGKSSIKADGHLLDEEYEMMAVVHDGQPLVHTRSSRPFEALFAKGVCAASDRPAVVAHFVFRQCDRISARIRKQAAAYPQPFLGQRRVKLPR
jgi:hypothetical protein